MDEIRELVTQLDSDDQVTVYLARRKLSDVVDGVTNPAESSRRRALAATLAVELTAPSDKPRVQLTNVPGADTTLPAPKHSVAARRFLCQLLNQIASDAEVPTLADALDDLEIRDAVVGVFQCVSTVVATVRLAAALAKVGPDFRIGVLNALGKQRWLEAQGALYKQARDDDPEIRLAAIEALANFPEVGNDAPIAEGAKTGTPRQRARACKARVRLAETLRIAGEKQSAIAIYRSLLTDTPAGPWQTAARQGLEGLQVKTG